MACVSSAPLGKPGDGVSRFRAGLHVQHRQPIAGTLRREIEQLLVQTGRVSPTAATAKYPHLFTHVFRLLSQPGLRVLEKPLLFEQLELAGNDDDGQLVDALERYLDDKTKARLVNVGAVGHINASSGLGRWPEGFALLQALVRD